MKKGENLLQVKISIIYSSLLWHVIITCMYFVTAVFFFTVGSSWPLCVLWGLMSFQFFFGFGHHAIVTSLRFEAGFIGLHGEIHAYNLPIAGALVGLNTLASQVIIGIN